MPGKKKKQVKSAAKRRKTNRAKTTRRRAASTRAKNKPAAAVLDSQKLQDLYAIMLKTRMLCEKALPLLSSPAKGPVAGMESKREAVLVGAIAHMLAGDSIATAQNRFLADFIQGASLQSILEQLFPEQVSGGGTTNHNETHSSAAVTMERGIALANEIKGNPNVVLVFPEESAAGPAIHYERLGFAASKKLPLVCMIETTQSSFEKQFVTQGSSTKIVRNFPRITVDGNDVVAVFRVAQEAVRRARAGHGPSLIECVMAQADSADRTHDPLTFMQQYLQRRNLWAYERQEKIVDQFSRELELAIASAGKQPERPSAFDRGYTSDRPVARSPQNPPTPEKTAPSRV